MGIITCLSIIAEMNNNREVARQRRQIDLLQTENNDLRKRLNIMAGVIEELMKVNENR